VATKIIKGSVGAKLQPVRVKVKGKIYPGMAKRNPRTGKVRVFVSPGVARKINPDLVQKKTYSVSGPMGTWGTFSRKSDALEAAKRQREADRQAGNRGRIKVVVGPGVARKVNPLVIKNPLIIKPISKEIYEREVVPRVRSGYKLIPFAIWKRTIGRGMHILYRDGEVIKVGKKETLKRLAKREAGF